MTVYPPRAVALLFGAFSLAGCFALLDFGAFDLVIDEAEGGVPDAAPSFQLLLRDTATVVVVAGGEASIIPIRVAREPGFADAVNVAAASLAEGLAVTPATIPGNEDAVDLSLRAVASFPLGPRTMRIIGASRSIEREVIVSIDVVPPSREGDFGDGGVALIPEAAGCVYSLFPRPDGVLAIGGDDQRTVMVAVADDGSIKRDVLDAGVLALAEPIATRPTLLPDGKIAISVLGAANAGSLLRFLPDGRPDPSFGTEGRVTLGARLFDLNHQADGRLVGASLVPDDAGADAGSILRLVRYTANGTIDPSFANAPIEVPVDLMGESAYPGNIFVGAGDVLLAILPLGLPSGCIQLLPFSATGTPGTRREVCGEFAYSLFGSGARDGSRAAVVVESAPPAGDRKTGILVAKISGDPDDTFGDGGVSLFPTPGTAFWSTAPSTTTGKWYSVGIAVFGAGTRLSLVRWNGDGSLDTSFRDPDVPFGVTRSVAGKKQSSFHAVVELPDGRVIAGGCVGVDNPGEQFALFRFVP